MDRLDELAAFVAIVDAGNLAEAGRRLGRSPPAMTRALAALEERVGARLLERTTRRSTPTEAGRRLVAHARQLLAGYDETLREPGAAAVRGLLRVTAPLVFGRRHVMPVVASFLDAHAEVRVELSLNDRSLNLVEEGLDVAVRIGALDDASLVARRVGEVRRVLVASRSYVALRGAPATLADIALHDVVYTANRPGPPHWRFGAGGRGRRDVVVRLEPRLVVNDVDAMLLAVRAGRGLARPLSYQVADDLAAHSLVRLLPEHEGPPLPVQLLVPSARGMPPKTRAFLDHAARALRQLGVIHALA